MRSADRPLSHGELSSHTRDPRRDLNADLSSLDQKGGDLREVDPRGDLSKDLRELRRDVRDLHEDLSPGKGRRAWNG